LAPEFSWSGDRASPFPSLQPHLLQARISPRFAPREPPFLNASFLPLPLPRSKNGVEDFFQTCSFPSKSSQNHFHYLPCFLDIPDPPLPGGGFFFPPFPVNSRCVQDPGKSCPRVFSYTLMCLPISSPVGTLFFPRRRVSSDPLRAYLPDFQLWPQVLTVELLPYFAIVGCFRFFTLLLESPIFDVSSCFFRFPVFFCLLLPPFFFFGSLFITTGDSLQRWCPLPCCANPFPGQFLLFFLSTFYRDVPSCCDALMFILEFPGRNDTKVFFFCLGLSLIFFFFPVRGVLSLLSLPGPGPNKSHFPTLLSSLNASIFL